MHWRWEPFWAWWQAQMSLPAPRPRAPVPTDPKQLRGVDVMRSLFAQVGRGHYHQHKRR
jgi:hypothetical protein